MDRRTEVFAFWLAAICLFLLFQTRFPEKCRADGFTEDITGKGMRPFPVIMDHDYAWRRASAWLDALDNARAFLPRETFSRLAELDLNTQNAVRALCACLFPLKSVTPEHSSNAGMVVVLAVPPDFAKKLAAFLADPFPVAEMAIILMEMSAAMENIRNAWPASVPNNPAQMAFLEEQAGLLDCYWTATGFDPDAFDARQAIIHIEEILHTLPECAPFWLMLAQKKAATGRPQSALEACDQALELCREFLEMDENSGAWKLFQNEVYLFRAEIHIHLHHDALATADLDAALRFLQKEGIRIDALKRIYDLMGELGRQKGDYAEMCSAYSNSCALGDCANLAAERLLGRCLPVGGMP